VKCLLQTGATATCINEDSLTKEEATLRPTLVRNKHPPKFINKVYRKSQKQNPINQETMKGTTVVLYIWWISEQICRIGENIWYTNSIQVMNNAVKHTHKD
jgi:hypothetical protein